MPLELDGRVYISSAKIATQANVHHLQVSIHKTRTQLGTVRYGL